VSGHSKWATIKHKKGKEDAKRGKLFSKLARAIMVAAREGGTDPNMNTALYNAVVAIIVEVLTDNRNRSAAEIRNIFSKHNGSLGQPGAVAWIFERHGSIIVDGAKHGEDDVVAAAADAGAEDIVLDGSSFEVLTEPTALAQVKAGLDAAGIGYEQAELTLVPKSTVQLDEGDARRTLKLIEALEDSDDVQEVYANFDIPDEVLEAVAG
jgi:YebC/PmpR family DNA-binding regulatory protein